MSFELAGRIALGIAHQTESIAGGFYSYFSTAPYAAGPEGVFAQPSIEGRTSSNQFAVAPDVQFKIGCAFTPRCRATIGYDFLYISSVMRPGDQLNRNLPKGQTFQQGGSAYSTTSPSRLSSTTDFFAHGFSVGLEFRF